MTMLRTLRSARGSQAETLSQPVMRPSLPMVTTALTTSLRSWAYSLSDVERIGLGIPAGDALGAVAVGEAVERTLLDDSVAVREVAEPRFRARGRRLQPEQGREEYCEPLHYSSRL